MKGIKNVSMIALSFFLTQSLFFLQFYHFLFSLGKRNVILATVLGFGLGAIFLFFFFAMRQRFYQYDLFLTHKKQKKILFLYRMILLFFLGIVCFYLLREWSFYIEQNFLKGESILLLFVSLFIMCYFLSDHGLLGMSRMCGLLFLLFFLFFVLTLFGLSPHLSLNQLYPPSFTSYSKTIDVVFKTAIITTLPFLSFCFLSTENEQKNPMKTRDFFFGYFLASAITTLEVIVLVCSLGSSLGSYYLYPEVMALRKISFFGIFDRMDYLLAMYHLFSQTIIVTLLFIIIRSHLPKRHS